MFTLRKLAMIFSFALTASAAFGQTVSYRFNYNDPYDIRPLKVNLQILNFEGQVVNYSAGVGLQAQYILGKAFTFEGTARYGLIDAVNGGIWDKNAETKRLEKSQTTNKVIRPLYLEAGAEWHFSDRLVDRKLSVNLAKGYNTETNMRIPIKARKIYSLRGGVASLNTPTTGGSDSIGLVSENGTKYGFDHHTNVFTKLAYAGISTRRIDKAGVSVDGYGNRRRNRNRQLFADALFGVTSINDIQLKSGATVAVNNTPTKNIGWRVGGQWIDNGTYFRMEFGQLPMLDWGFANIYGMMSFGLTVFGNEKGLKHMKTKSDGATPGN